MNSSRSNGIQNNRKPTAWPDDTGEAQDAKKPLTIWYKTNVPFGVARGIFPGRVVWSHNPKVASWDMKTGFWWEDRFNNQQESDKLVSNTITALAGQKNESKAWDKLFRHFNKVRNKKDSGYRYSVFHRQWQSGNRISHLHCGCRLSD